MANRAPLLTAIVVSALGAAASAQRAEFEVASVKPHTSDDQRVMMVTQPGGRFVASNIPLRLLIRTAFRLQDDQIVGGPNWLATDRFDIEARASEPSVPPAQMLVLLQSLLADRFKLTTHTEKRELPVFALERSKRDGSLGPALQPTGDPSALSIFTALQEQLGLRLNSTRDTVDILVIDALEHPTPN